MLTTTDTSPTDTAAALLEVAGQVAGFSNQLAEAGKATAIEIKGLSDKLRNFYKAQTEFLEKRMNAEGEGYDPDQDPEFKRFVAKNEPRDLPCSQGICEATDAEADVSPGAAGTPAPRNSGQSPSGVHAGRPSRQARSEAWKRPVERPATMSSAAKTPSCCW